MPVLPRWLVTPLRAATGGRPGRRVRPSSFSSAPWKALKVTAAFALSACAALVVAPPASAAYQQQTGHVITPGQPYGGKERSADWLGTYLVDGKQVFCVQFEYKAPDTDEQYQPGDELRTKWGDPLPPEVAANISYLLLRYGDTTNPDQAAALAHLLHSWTAPAREGHDDLNPAHDFRHIGYDAPFHLAKLPPAAQQAVSALAAEAEANRGPWTASVTAPQTDQVIGTEAEWTITVRNAKDTGVAGIPVVVEVSDATLSGGPEVHTSTQGSVTTGEDGTATIKVTPTGPNPKVVATLSAPADKPYVRVPVDLDTQRVVSTGGEKELKAEATTTALNKPGKVQITKVDSGNGQGISGAVLRLTGNDTTSPVTAQDGKPVTGPDGEPVVVTTDDQGVASVDVELRAPQEVCVVEVSPPDGYDQAFDAANPPSVCGAVQPGETLTLRLSNVPNAVPVAIPAGDPPESVVLRAETTIVTAPAGLATTAGLALLGSALVGFVARRKLQR